MSAARALGLGRDRAHCSGCTWPITGERAMLRNCHHSHSHDIMHACRPVHRDASGPWCTATNAVALRVFVAAAALAACCLLPAAGGRRPAAAAAAAHESAHCWWHNRLADTGALDAALRPFPRLTDLTLAGNPAAGPGYADWAVRPPSTTSAGRAPYGATEDPLRCGWLSLSCRPLPRAESALEPGADWPEGAGWGGGRRRDDGGPRPRPADQLSW